VLTRYGATQLNLAADVDLAGPRPSRTLLAREVSACPKICTLAHAFPWEDSHKRLKWAQFLAVCLTYSLLTLSHY
jgi:hypothetical protein